MDDWHDCKKNESIGQNTNLVMITIGSVEIKKKKKKAYSEQNELLW